MRKINKAEATSWTVDVSVALAYAVASMLVTWTIAYHWRWVVSTEVNGWHEVGHWFLSILRYDWDGVRVILLWILGR